MRNCRPSVYGKLVRCDAQPVLGWDVVLLPFVQNECRRTIKDGVHKKLVKKSCALFLEELKTVGCH